MRQVLLSVMLCAGLASGAELPVSEVVIYKNGVGFFVRSGEVKAGESATIGFRQSEMNDVLKSLTVQDRGGAVTRIRYDGSEPLSTRLSEFPFTLGPKLTLSAFLDEMKGARVEVRMGPETLNGVVFSARTLPGDKDRAERELIVLLLDSGELRTIDLSATLSVRFENPEIQKQLAAYLAILQQSRARDRRAIRIEGDRTGARHLTASYTVPTPVWKSSYRLLFSDAGQPSLEGWAIVDNTTGEDWTGVRLALVSGRPVSFISQLYEPKYVHRRTVELAGNTAAAPVVSGGVVGGVVGAMQAAAPQAPPPPRTMAARKFAQAEAADEVRDAASTIAPAAVGQEAGELFEYRFSTPVTVRNGESAMLPFTQGTIAARKLLLWTGSEGANPLHAAELSNTTGKTLDGGPITVFEGSSYTGEALIETLKAGDKRLISYSVDLGTRVTTAYDSSREQIRELHLRRGVLTTRAAVQETRTYTIRNVDKRGKTLIIEQPVRPGYELLTKTPVERTVNAYRFEVSLDPDSTTRFPVVEERLEETTSAVTSYTPDMLLSFVRNRGLSEAARKQLEAIAARKREIADNDRAIQSVDQEILAITRDQDRLRQNIESLNRVAGQQERVQQYARDLGAAETRIAALRDRRRELEQRKTELQRELDAAIEAADF